MSLNQVELSKGSPPSDRLVVWAGPGEANRLAVARGAGGELQITDQGAPLRAETNCTPIEENRVDCQTTASHLEAFVFAGDMDDTVSSSVAVNVDGGSGSDQLLGSPFADVLYGGEGQDRLRGEDGDDALKDGRLRAEALENTVTSEVYPPVEPVAPVRAERDAFDGGAGTDTLGYEGRRRGVVGNLALPGRAGARGEGDTLRGLEGLGGGNGGDRLFGDDAANFLWGGAGDDLLVGRAGDDQLEVGAGSNRARGDAGDDSIGLIGDATRHLELQQVACGDGRDHVLFLFPNDYAQDDCESVVVGLALEIHPSLPPISWSRPPLASYSTTATDCIAPSCSVGLEVRLARSPSRRLPRLKGLLLARASATIPTGGLTTLTARLSRRGSRILRRHRTLLIRIQLNIVQSNDPRIRLAGAYLTRLRAPAGSAALN